MMNNSEGLFFPAVENGYDKEQVDIYVNKLSEAYQAAYDENELIREKYNNLLDTYKTANGQNQSAPTSEVATKTLMYAEVLAQKIISEALEEASRTKAEAQLATADALEEATRANEKAQLTIANAREEVMRAKAEAQQAIAHANTEIVERTRRNLEQAQKIMVEAINKVESLLTFNASYIKNSIAS